MVCAVSGDRSNRVPRVAVIVPCNSDGANLTQRLMLLEEEEPHEMRGRSDNRRYRLDHLAAHPLQFPGARRQRSA